MIKVLLFAHLQEEVGTNELEIEVESLTLKALIEKMKSDYKLTRLENVMVAVNEEYASEEDVVNSGDVVAFIPPVSGG